MQFKEFYVIGPGRGGKDTLSRELAHFLSVAHGTINYFTSSSELCAEKFIFARMNRLGFCYGTWQECFEDRHNYRDLWHDMIAEFNVEGWELSELIFEDSPVYCGIRSSREHKAYLERCYKSGKPYPLSIWVEPDGRTPPEDSSSMNIDKGRADVIIYNHTDLMSFYARMTKLFEDILKGGFIFKDGRPPVYK